MPVPLGAAALIRLAGLPQPIIVKQPTAEMRIMNNE